MVTPADVRTVALSFPEVVESTHFGFPSFKVGGKPVVGVEKGGETAGVVVPPEIGAALAEAEPMVFEEIWRNAGRPVWVGVRVQLDAVERDRMTELIEHAWRFKAARRLVKEYDSAP